jgi:broad specificity phosphatase PhoE
MLLAPETVEPHSILTVQGIAISEGPFSAATAQEGRILVVWHAQSAANAGGRTADPASIPITDAGMRQSQCVADLVSERPAIIVVSGDVRTVQTAEPLLRRYPTVPVHQWRVEEFTYLDTDACAGATYSERKTNRNRYWTRCDPLWIDGPACECFADFVVRIHHFEQALITTG